MFGKNGDKVEVDAKRKRNEMSYITQSMKQRGCERSQ